MTGKVWAAILSACQPRLLIRGLILMAGLSLVAWAMSAGLAHYSASQWVDLAVRGRGATGVALFLAIGALIVAVGMPRQAVGFAGGYAFGVAWGTVLAMAAQLLGCFVVFSYARFLARAALRTRFPGRVQRLDRFLKDHPVSMTILVRLLPAPGLLTNLAAGVSSVPPLAFLLGSLLGYLPQTIVFALLGKGTRIDSGWSILASVILFAGSTIVGGLLYRYRRGSDLEEAD